MSYLCSTKPLLVQHQVLTSVAPNPYLYSTKIYLHSTKRTSGFLVSSLKGLPSVAPTPHNLPASISSMTMLVKILLASNLASSDKIPVCGAGEKETVPLTMWPLMMAPKWTTCLVGLDVVVCLIQRKPFSL